MCVCVFVMLCRILIIAVRLGNKVIFTIYHRWHYMQATVNSCNAPTIRPLNVNTRNVNKYI